MLSYEEFKEEVVERIGEISGKRVITNQFRKANGILLDGLSIISPDRNVSPTIYLNEYYNDYKERMDIDEDAVEDISKCIYNVYEMHLPKVNFDVKKIREYENVKNNIKIKLLSIAMNKELLEEVVYKKFMDLAITFYVEIQACNGEQGSVAVRKELCEIWGVSAEDLYEAAMDNMANDFEIMELGSIFKNEFGCDTGNIDCVHEMFVLTNKTRIYGASGMLMMNMFQELAEKNKVDDIIILPSSLHELILVFEEEGVDSENYNMMVRQVNQQSVRTEEILSNHIYIYNRIRNEIYM